MQRLHPASRGSKLAIALAALAFASPLFAAHPLQTEDTGTQGVGNVEFENGFVRSRADGGTVFSYQPQLSYGVTSTTDLIVQPAWLLVRGPDDARVNGFGDTNLDAKWRFFGRAPWSLGVRAGLEIPTNQRGLGLPHGRTAEHAVLVATFDAAPLTIHANLGATRVPDVDGDRRWIEQVSTAAMWAPDDRWSLTAEVASAAEVDRSRHRWSTAFLFGAIYTIRPGLDVDGGVQLTRSSTPSRALLLGVTWRFAP